MKRLNWSLLALFAFASFAVKAQSGDQIVSNYISAIGGKDNLAKIKSIVMESTMNVMGNDAPMTTTILNGKGFRSDVEFNGQKIIQAVNETGGWMINPMMGATSAQPMPAEQFAMSKSQMVIGGSLMNYASDGGKAEYKGTEKVGSVDAQKVVITAADKSTTTYYFDPATHYMVKMDKTMNMGGQEGLLTIGYSDYRKTDAGIAVPYAVETTLPQGFSMSATVKKVEVNKDIDPKIFQMPK